MSHIEYSLDRSAALKILLHSAKYPAAAINGVLLGKVKPTKQQVVAADPGSPRTQRLQLDIVDAVPLLHTFLTLAPALETALALVRQAPHECAIKCLLHRGYVMPGDLSAP